MDGMAVLGIAVALIAACNLGGLLIVASVVRASRRSVPQSETAAGRDPNRRPELRVFKPPHADNPQTCAACGHPATHHERSRANPWGYNGNGRCMGAGCACRTFVRWIGGYEPDYALTE